jgi:signal transduction histidine kinase
MKIRTKLTLIFFGIVIVIVSVISVSIYYFSSTHRQEDFHRRLKNRAINTAQLLTGFEEVDADLLKRMEKDNPASLPNQFVIIYDYKNQVLYSSDSRDIAPKDSTLLDRVRLQNEIRFEKGDYEILGYLFTHGYDRFTIIAGATDLYGHDALRNLRNILIITFAVSVVFVSILSWFYAGKVLSPISKIVNDVDSITEASLDQRLDEGNRTDELSKLAQTFNRMLSRLEAAFTSQKNFIANASHELKTPFTVMAGEIEVTLLHPRNNEYYIRVLQSVLDGIRGLNKLSTQLLLLAQTSADHPEKRFSSIRIDDILWEAKHELIRLHGNYVIEIEFDINIDHDSLIIEGDEQLIKVLIMNLMDNGCKYGENNQVNVTLRSKHGSIVIEFVNAGKGIEPTELHHIFDPFYRGKHDKKIKGFGIGLSLASKIINLHDAQIKVQSIPNEFTLFEITFPVKNISQAAVARRV